MTSDPISAPSPNHDARPGARSGAQSDAVDMIVLHYTGMQSGEAALERLRDKDSRVSSHYLVEEDGRVFRLVEEDRRAWHAGVSRWAGRDLLNDCSVGIEIVNPGHEWGYRDFPEAQMREVEALVKAIALRHGVAPERVLGHSDIAPTRKDDPGERFDWRRLGAQGVAVWPRAAEVAAAGRLLDPEGVAVLAGALRDFGYDLRDFPATLRAFRRRFRPSALQEPPRIRDLLIARELAARWPCAPEPRSAREGAGDVI